jgi:hypothetical protein
MRRLVCKRISNVVELSYRIWCSADDDDDDDDDEARRL